MTRPTGIPWSRPCFGVSCCPAPRRFGITPSTRSLRWATRTSRAFITERPPQKRMTGSVQRKPARVGPASGSDHDHRLMVQGRAARPPSLSAPAPFQPIEHRTIYLQDWPAASGHGILHEKPLLFHITRGNVVGESIASPCGRSRPAALLKSREPRWCPATARHFC